jgi:hypothetical protein
MITISQAFRHSYTKEFGSHHVNNDGSERYCIVYSVYFNNQNLPSINLEYNSSDNMYLIQSNRDYFDNFLPNTRVKTKKQAIEIITNSYNNYLESI